MMWFIFHGNWYGWIEWIYFFEKKFWFQKKNIWKII
jgi:hypothetical protein